MAELDYRAVLNDLETTLKIKPKKIPAGLGRLMTVDGFYHLANRRVAIKIMSSFGWNEAKELWRVWDSIGAEMSSPAKFLGRIRSTFLIVCNSCDSEAALWINYLCRRYAPSTKGAIILLDVGKHLVFWQESAKSYDDLTPFMLGMGFQWAVSLVDSQTRTLAYWKYSENRWRSVATPPSNITFDNIFVNGKLERLKSMPRPYYMGFWISGMIALVTLFLGFAAFVFNESIGGFLLLVFLLSSIISMTLNYLSQVRLRANMHKLLHANDNP